MHRAVEKLQIQPEFLIIDGNRFKPFKNIPFACIVKGDGKFYSIAAASVLAKRTEMILCWIYIANFQTMHGIKIKVIQQSSL